MTDSTTKPPDATSTRALAEAYLRSVLIDSAKYDDSKTAVSKIVLQHIPVDAVAPSDTDPLVELQAAAEKGSLRDYLDEVSSPLPAGAKADAIRG